MLVGGARLDCQKHVTNLSIPPQGFSTAKKIQSIPADRDSVTEIFTTHDHSEPARTGGQEPVSPHRSTPNKSGRPKAALIVLPHVLSFTQALYCATALITPNVPA